MENAIPQTDIPFIQIPHILKESQKKRKAQFARANMSAQIQNSFRASAKSGTTIRMKTARNGGTHRHFFDALSDDLQDVTNESYSLWDQYIAARDIFQSLIDHFPNQKEGLNKVKSGYDNQLEKLNLTIQGYNKNKLIRHQSQREINKEIEQLRKKYETKRKKLVDKIWLAREQITLTKQDNQELQESKKQYIADNTQLTFSSEGNVHILQEFEIECNILSSKYNSMKEEYDNIIERTKAAEIGIHDGRIRIGDVLEDISISTKELDKLNHEIQNIESKIDELNQMKSNVEETTRSKELIVLQKQRECADVEKNIEEFKQKVNELKTSIILLIGRCEGRKLPEEPQQLLQFYIQNCR
ncbi:hypothetical protein TVAG_170220 [Trichomonas vaginalis G3]|uniref:Uncharacterized protein n=1 Tax=Trichomonas vaginalis (strain ATCC PRA-98 / G3) TaxID=412133 RepID=A2DPG4_TRIV3|nr:hypothetical protein TVAGG3_0680680 [Trichomonas vaginalis G3]EAY17708.1 hypothetical protein TVAG_170220 [Trichomonas vaginalis G3]KAI5507887.1 hypothetical protein TVAGG3_0680680 [Trichomonas vaginalis G3]|eukprot:XP_001329843.1 hypothetical protein [Trichomonas vaginalis G3]